MKGAIFYASKYGSTAQYARWIGEATGLPIFDVDDRKTKLEGYDFLVLGSPIIYYKLIFRKWAARNLLQILERPTILFSVSGAGPGPKLDRWIAECLDERLVAHVDHVALRGRQVPKDLTWFDRMMLIIAGIMNPDRKAAKDEMKGFDAMDKDSIAPIVKKIEQLKSQDAEVFQMHAAGS